MAARSPWDIWTIRRPTGPPFTPDGWFRTGDLGFVDRRGFLHVTGRSKEILVLGGGKKVNPEDLERYFAEAPQIREIAVLEQDGRLVALVQPDPARVREMGTMNLREGIRVALAERSQGLPEYQRLYGFALTDQSLPRTRLGKHRRFMLPDLYRQAPPAGRDERHVGSVQKIRLCSRIRRRMLSGCFCRSDIPNRLSTWT